MPEGLEAAVPVRELPVTVTTAARDSRPSSARPSSSASSCRPRATTPTPRTFSRLPPSSTRSRPCRTSSWRASTSPRNERAHAIKAANKAVKLAPDSSQAYNTRSVAPSCLRFQTDGQRASSRSASAEPSFDAGQRWWAWKQPGLRLLAAEEVRDARSPTRLGRGVPARKGSTGYMWNKPRHRRTSNLTTRPMRRDAFDNGAKLGSLEAKASASVSRVSDTIVVMKDEPPRPR